MSQGQDDEKLFHDVVVKRFSSLCLVVLCRNGSQLREATSEVLALQRVQINKPELNNDAVAKREFFDRLTAAEMAEDELLQNLLEFPEHAAWVQDSRVLPVHSKRELQQQLSAILKAAFHSSPVILNELINRDKPSSQAAAARNKLLQMMMQHETLPDLGIEKFPPEKAIYRSLLRKTGLHQLQKNGDWAFSAPHSNDKGMNAVWGKLIEFLDSTETNSRSFVELNDVLMAPPYGLKAGVLPLLYVTVYLVHQHELALYHNRVYKPYFTEELVDQFLKRPNEFELQQFKISGIRASLFKEYGKALHGDDGERTLLDLAKALAGEMGRLPEYTQKTEQGLSAHAREVRSAFNLAKSPEKLLFNDLPKALGFSELAESSNESTLLAFSQAFTGALKELRSAYAKLLDRQRSLLAQAFNYSPQMPLSELRKVVAGRCHGLEQYTVDTQGLRALLMRLTKTLGNDQEWFETVLMFLGHKPTAKWSDSDQSVAEHRLTTFSRGILDLEKLRHHESSRVQQLKGDFDVYLLRCIKKGGEATDEVVAIDQSSHKHIRSTKEAISAALAGLEDKELRLAALAEIVDEFFNNYRLHGSKTQSDSTGSKKADGKRK